MKKITEAWIEWRGVVVGWRGGEGGGGRHQGRGIVTPSAAPAISLRRTSCWAILSPGGTKNPAGTATGNVITWIQPNWIKNYASLSNVTRHTTRNSPSYSQNLWVSGMTLRNPWEQLTLQLQITRRSESPRFAWHVRDATWHRLAET